MDFQYLQLVAQFAVMITLVITPTTHEAGLWGGPAWVPCCLLEMTFSQRFCVSDLIITQTGSYCFQDLCSTDGEFLLSEVQSGCLRAEDTLLASLSADSHSLISRNIPLAISCWHHNFLHNISKSFSIVVSVQAAVCRHDPKGRRHRPSPSKGS